MSAGLLCFDAIFFTLVVLAGIWLGDRLQAGSKRERHRRGLMAVAVAAGFFGLGDWALSVTHLGDEPGGSLALTLPMCFVAGAVFVAGVFLFFCGPKEAA